MDVGKRFDDVVLDVAADFALAVAGAFGLFRGFGINDPVAVDVIALVELLVFEAFVEAGEPVGFLVVGILIRIAVL